MIIHQRPRKSFNLPRAVRSSAGSMAVIAVVALLVTMLGAAGFRALKSWVGPWALDHGYEENLHGRMRTELQRLPYDWVRGVMTPARVPQLHLDIGFQHLQRLRAQRADAVAKGWLVQGEDDYVPARIRWGARTLKADLRLKGDLTDQLERGKWSFRVHMKGDHKVLGMQRFSLHHPRARDYHGEALFLETVRLLGLLAPRYRFVDVSLNGDFIGRLALEEHFSKELLESSGRRDGVILKFDESDRWSAYEPGLWGDYGPTGWRTFTALFDYKTASVDAFRMRRIQSTPSLVEDLRVGAGLLDAFARGTIPPSQAFDPVATGAFIAICEAWGARHALVWQNTRFYYDPLSGRLEPIAFDGNVADVRSVEATAFERTDLATDLLADSRIRAAYRATLERLAEELGQGPLGDSLRTTQDRILTELRRHYPLVRPFGIGAIGGRAARLLEVNENPFPGVHTDRLLRVTRVDGEAESYLELTSRIPEPLEVLEILWRDSTGQRVQPVRYEGAPLPIRLSPRPQRSRPEVVRLPYTSAASAEWKELAVVFVRPRTGDRAAAVARPGLPPLREPPILPSRTDDVLARHPFLRPADGGRTLRALPGRWRVDETLHVPEDVTLELGPGTTLAFTPNAALVARGPLVMRGSRDVPVRLVPAGPSADGQWAGIVVLDAGESEWSHVLVEGTRGIRTGTWSVPAGVTFYRSPVRMTDVSFRGNRTEDALNLVRSPFVLQRLLFEDALSDALDVDFSEGRIEDSSFRDIGFNGGGDAIDVSGARVRINGVNVLRVDDKALSVGEGSRVWAASVTVKEAGAGAVVKDGSTLWLSESNIANVRAGLMAYTKKTEYGPARLEAEGVDVRGAQRQTVAQTGSSLLRDGREDKPEDLDVELLYETVMRKGGQ